MNTIGLAPLDGITDTAFRHLVDFYSKPSIMFTEFVPIEGLVRGKTKLLNAFMKHKSQTPVIGQVFGINEDSFYKSFFVVAEMGLDGIDVNMGCPDRGVVKRGGGAGLIKNFKQAQKIIKTLKRARNDWFEGKRIKDLNVPENLVFWIHEYIKKNNFALKTKTFTISVKTRIGYDKPNVKEWIDNLLEVSPDIISIHGRTFIQKYTGKADWEEIKKAVVLAKKTKTKIWGNGDVKSMKDAKNHIHTYGVNGVLVGRAALGNPWFFSNRKPTPKEKLVVMIEHANLFMKYRPDLGISPLRKHFCWYCADIPHYRKIRDLLMHASSLDDVKKIVSHI